MQRMTFRHFHDLSDKQQQSALDMCARELLQAIVAGSITFNDDMTHALYGTDVHGDDLQERIEAACQEAQDMQTPWFAHEYVLDTCREDIFKIARAHAEGILYARGGQRIARVLPNDTVCRA